MAYLWYTCGVQHTGVPVGYMWVVVDSGVPVRVADCGILHVTDCGVPVFYNQCGFMLTQHDGEPPMTETMAILQIMEPIQSFWKVHGKAGVTDVRYHGDEVYTAGRDGQYRCYTVDGTRLELLHGSKVNCDGQADPQLPYCFFKLLNNFIWYNDFTESLVTGS